MPIPIEVLRRVTVVYVHANCPDGLASAMILKHAFRMLGTSPRIEFLAHNTPEHRRAGVLGAGKSGDEFGLFCDIAPHPVFDVQDDYPLKFARRDGSVVEIQKGDRIQEMVYAERNIVLDHHKGAEEIVRAFGELGVFADEKLEPGVSGAVLAYREVWSPVRDAELSAIPKGMLLTAVENFAVAVGARDTWQTSRHPEFERGQWTSKMLMAKPASYWLEDHPPYLTGSEIETGRELFMQHVEAVRQAVDQCVYFNVGDPAVRMAVFQEQACGFRLTSDLAEVLRKRKDESVDVVAGFSYVVDKPGDLPKLLFSLRGLNGFNVAAFAKENGGGGHTAAAGFSVVLYETPEPVDPYDVVRWLLAKHLSSLTR